MKFLFQIILLILFWACSKEPGGDVKLPDPLLWEGRKASRTKVFDAESCPMKDVPRAYLKECIGLKYSLRGWDSLSLYALRWEKPKFALEFWSQQDSSARTRSLWVGSWNIKWFPQGSVVTSAFQRDKLWKSWGLPGVDWGQWMEKFPKPLLPEHMLWLEKELLGVPIETDFFCQEYLVKEQAYKVCRSVYPFGKDALQGWINRWSGIQKAPHSINGLQWVQIGFQDALYAYNKGEMWIWYGKFPLHWAIHWFESHDLLENSP